MSITSRIVSFLAFNLWIIPIALSQSKLKERLIVGFLFFIIGMIVRFFYLRKATNFAVNAGENNKEIAILWVYVALSIFLSLFLCMVLGVFGVINFETGLK
ncbi:hypothetical protein [Ostreibacterium oceani]|uniref:Uncharacterized protein n=1 Tax=Ostreibacterium oceani TaxID=2654998 RepID=A0A6N7F3U3_9GAMM|nr:hypothetical protein [Ostreibacterium oceani]MPV86546.1 hypothetical protein [Ostreibacterium oceani]